MKDRVPGAPGRYRGSLPVSEFQKLQKGEPFAITLTRDDAPVVAGTPYSKAAVLPDTLAAKLCPGMADPTPADALGALEKNKAPAGFGLGNAVKIEYSAIDQTVKPGWYCFNHTTSICGVSANFWYMLVTAHTDSNYCTQQLWSCTDNHDQLVRHRQTGVWTQWEPAGDIVAQGTSGNWIYRKWKSGIAECWSKQTFACDSTASEITLAFPFLFAEEPVVMISAKRTPLGTLVGSVQGECSASGPEVLPYFDIYQAYIQLLQIQGADGTVFPIAETGDFNVYCVGKWK